MKLALGTVQFGLDYGVTNNGGKVPIDEVNRILEFAYSENISVLDTAIAYGDSEKVIGLAYKPNNDFKHITKLPSSSNLCLEVDELILNSIYKLKTDRLYAVLFHDENDLFNKRTHSSLQKLSRLKRAGKVTKIGASFYSIKALEKALDVHELDIIQIPASCLDQRFETSGLLKLAKSKGIEVHARSLFLQGLLLDKQAEIPENITPYMEELDKFFEFSTQVQLTPLELCLIYLIQNQYIDFGVVGCLTQQQLSEVVAAYQYVSKHPATTDMASLASSSEKLINPSLWK